MEFFPSLVDLLRHSSYTFDSGTFQHIDGCYVFDSHLPRAGVCCCAGQKAAGMKPFHRHGHYPRALTTFLNGHLSQVTVWNLRWKCPLCGATFSITPPNVMYRQRICIFVIFLLAFLYLNSSGGIDTCYPPELDSVRERAQLRRYHRQLRQTAQITQQSIREAIVQRIGPEDYERMTLSGLSPPKSLRKCRDPHSCQIWESLHLIEVSSRFLIIPLALLLSRARERATLLSRPFLTQLR
jgi:hypothetical protein